MYLNVYKIGFIWKRKERLSNFGICIVKSIILCGLFYCLFVWIDEVKKLDEVVVLFLKELFITETDVVIAVVMVVIVNGVEIEIDEDLFGGDDIDDVEDELEILDLVDD